MKSSSLAALVITLLMPSHACPQDPAQPKRDIPSGPLLKSAPDFSRWEISFSYPKPPNKQPAEPASGKPAMPVPAGLSKVVTTKTREIIHEEETDSNGQRSEKWHVGSLQYAQPPGKSVWYESDAGKLPDGSASDPSYSPLPASGFRELDWISPAAYAGTIKYNGRDCLVFVRGDAAGGDNPEQRKAWLESRETISYIDAESRLPVLVRIGGETRIYRFAGPPAEMQSLPADVQERVKKAEEARSRLHQLPPRPF